MENPTQSSPISWSRILVFFIIATALSNVFRFDIFEIKPLLKQLPAWVYVLVLVFLEGSGVFLAALIGLYYLKKNRKIEVSLFGTSKSKSLLMAIIPILLLTLIGVQNEFDLNTHLYGLIAVLGTFIYCILEEYGWRAYLQEELRSLKSWQKYFLIGLIWYLWHLTFLTEATLGDNLFFLAMMIFGSWGIGEVAESTKSILACACFHLIIQIMMFNALIRNGIDGTEKLIILGISVGVWFVIVKKWEKENALANPT